MATVASYTLENIPGTWPSVTGQEQRHFVDSLNPLLVPVGPEEKIQRWEMEAEPTLIWAPVAFFTKYPLQS